MEFALLGGDRRSVYLGELLKNDGHGVEYFALEKACRCEAVTEEGLNKAQCVVLGIPSVKNGLINAPLSDEAIEADTVAGMLTPAQTLCVVFGKTPVNTKAEVFDFMTSRSFSEGNAALTAEAAVALLIEGSESALENSEILILGNGRLAKALVTRLESFNAAVTVGARRGADTVSIEKALSDIGRFDYTVNTVPARIIPDGALRDAKRGSVIMELASAPFGFDSEKAEEAGLKAISAPALPGRFSPLASAELMKRSIYEYMEGVSK